MRSRILFLTLLVFATAAAIFASPADDAAKRKETFDLVWTTINEKHYDPTFGGVDWKKVGDTYRPKAMAAKDDNEFHKILMEMLSELKLSHFGIYSTDVSFTAESGGVTGVELKMIDGKPVITSVKSGSPAEKAGIKQGFILESIDGKTVAAMTEPLKKNLAERKVSDEVAGIYLASFLTGSVNGSLNKPVKAGFLDADDKAFNVELAPVAFTGEMSPAIGNFPPQEVVFESRQIGESVGYIKFNIWVIPQMPKIRQALAGLKNNKALIIDLRGNPGGLGGMASGVGGLLTDKRFSLGSMRSRENLMEFIAHPQKNAFLGKVIILQDGGSGSTSEVFAAGMQEQGRAKVVGQTSAGAVLPSVFVKLPTGAMFQYAISDYRSPKDVFIEGRGVKPDVEAKLSRKDLLKGVDSQLEAAVKTALEE